MQNVTFGSYLKMLRQKHNPMITQEQLAVAISRTKMTICQFEQGKNAPPKGRLLDKIIKVLDLNDEERSMLRFLSAKQRKEVPDDIEGYFFSNPIIYELIRTAKNNRVSTECWEKIKLQFGESHE